MPAVTSTDAWASKQSVAIFDRPTMPCIRRTRHNQYLWGCAVMVFMLLLATPAEAQRTPTVSKYNLPTAYRDARFQRLVTQIFKKHGARVQPLPAAHLASAYDSLTTWLMPFYPGYVPYVPPPKPFNVESWRVIKRQERLLYAKQFDRVKWAYLGNNYLTALDTTHTQAIRARMQAQFGDPTETLAEVNFGRNLQSDEYIQFEYWFILNDSIPMVVMDVNGPFDRGLVVACDHRFREILFTIRQSFLAPMMTGGRLAPFVDYYYNYRARRWYRTGFDGRRFFLDSISQPNLARGRPELRSEGG